MHLTFVGINSYRHKFASRSDEIFGREQTVLRGGVAGSEHTGDSSALRCGRHEHDCPSAALRFRSGRLPCRVPLDPWFPQVKLRRPQVSRRGSTSTLASRSRGLSEGLDRDAGTHRQQASEGCRTGKGKTQQHDHIPLLWVSFSAREPKRIAPVTIHS